MNTEKMQAILAAIGVALFLALFLFFNAGTLITCEGTIVRGLFWLECIN